MRIIFSSDLMNISFKWPVIAFNLISVRSFYRKIVYNAPHHTAICYISHSQLANGYFVELILYYMLNDHKIWAIWAKNEHDQWGALTLRNPFYNRLDARAKNKTVVDPMATNKYNIANTIHAMYSLRLQEDICQILVHRMQHNNKVPSEIWNWKKWGEKKNYSVSRSKRITLTCFVDHFLGD